MKELVFGNPYKILLFINPLEDNYADGRLYLQKKIENNIHINIYKK